MTSYQADVQAIEKLVEDLFAAISWDEKTSPNWDAFRSKVKSEVVLYPSARPVNPTSLDPFIAMMQGQKDSGGLRTFDEAVTGHKILVFGNFAVGLSAYSQQINGGDIGYGVNGFVFIKENGQWKIGAMCWDKETTEHPIPADLK